MASEVLTALNIQVYILWCTMPRSIVYYQRFEDTRCSHLRGRKKETAGWPETLVPTTLQKSYNICLKIGTALPVIGRGGP
jgi:hypothetical protein